MEKTSSHRFPPPLKINLPKINNENVDNLKSSPTPSSCEKIVEFKKAYFQYKSNARIIEKSPYCSSQNKRQILHLIKGRNNEKSLQRIIDLRDHDMESGTVEVQLLYKGNFYLLNFKVQTSGELKDRLLEKVKVLEKEFYSCTREKHIFKETIIGFETLKSNLCTDFTLSYPNFPLTRQIFKLKPVFKRSFGKKIKLTDFKILQCLGSGGFSTVYLAKGLFNNVFYALKLINKEFIMDTERDGIISNERFILGQLHSPFITELEFAFETMNHFIFAIQYCPGGQLFNQLKKVKKMNEEQARFYFLEILIGLDYIHTKNIVYRDLKPQNLLIDAEGHIKIADFGLSKPVLNFKTHSFSFCGSPEYMAPEMLLKKGHNYLLDYYCLGALLYELVVGVPPYYSTNQEEIHEAILSEELSFPSHARLSEELVSLLQGLLLKDVNQRLGCLYGVKQILFHPWVGKVSRKTVESKKLVPPFIPDLEEFNFDLEDVKTDLDELMKKLEEDKRVKKFQTCFNEDFYYERRDLREGTERTGLMGRLQKETKKTTHLFQTHEKSERKLKKRKNPRFLSLRKSTSTIARKL